MIEEFLYQVETLNPKWKEEDKLSPLVIYSKGEPKSYFIEFLFIPECYERKSNKTTLRNNWIEYF